MVKKMAEGILSNPHYSTNMPHFNRTQKFDRFPMTSVQDEDINPIHMAPVPSWRDEISSATDPSLTLTPERSSKPKISNNPQTTNPPVVTKTKMKQKQRVRFDLDNDDDDLHSRDTPDSQSSSNTNSPSKSTPQKAYCPQMYISKPDQNVNDDELDITQMEDEIITINRRCDSVETAKSDYSEKTNSRSSSVDLSFTETALKYLAIRESEISKSESPNPPQIVDSVPSHVHKCHAVKNVIVTREYENRSTPNTYQFPFVDTASSRESEHVLARPEYNTTLKISEELKDLKASKPKVAQTLKQKLKSSEETRTDINEKASVKVNRNGELFSGLVGVDPDINKLCLEVERGITGKVKPKVKSTNKGSTASGKKSDPKAPDILEFYTDDRQREIPDLSLTNITIATESLSTADPMTAFDLYRHNRVWDTLHN
ncbi:hypothetical protein LOTGIDRAFT_231887 [Lottia gigantea]|uniref:Protein phosphatase 1 regulatory subunit 35 C-terminal domain-containing protein n=1 Tax=Lottia gigantea TaxID=225164 RepID=V3ZVW2_LOTGI|nr:hypothetical protein LOTGIDRAFT_231887 [Lottia gigantea]ESO95653.1 hypothetical protein LOTGIDRAFT_231887 [Lottia gigantea]